MILSNDYFCVYFMLLSKRNASCPIRDRKMSAFQQSVFSGRRRTDKNVKGFYVSEKTRISSWCIRTLVMYLPATGCCLMNHV